MASRLKPSVEEMLSLAAPPKGATPKPEDDDRALERQKLARMAAHLRDDLYAKESKTRQEAAVRLGRVEHPAAIRALTVALSHSDTVVRYLAKRSLKAFLEKPDLFDVDGDMTHSAVKSAVARADKEEASKGPAVGEFNWSLAWAAVLLLMTLLYLIFGRGQPEPATPRGPRRPKASRVSSGSAESPRAGQVKLGGDRQPSGDRDRSADTPAPDDGRSAAGVVDRSPAPPAEDPPRQPAGGRGEGVRPEDYPSDSPPKSETAPDPDKALRSRSEKTGEPEASPANSKDEPP